MSLRRRKSSLCQGEGMPTDFRNILLIKPSSLGDIVHALPTAAVLHRRFPAARQPCHGQGGMLGAPAPFPRNSPPRYVGIDEDRRAGALAPDSIGEPGLLLD